MRSLPLVLMLLVLPTCNSDPPVLSGPGPAPPFDPADFQGTFTLQSINWAGETVTLPHFLRNVRQDRLMLMDGELAVLSNGWRVTIIEALQGPDGTVGREETKTLAFGTWSGTEADSLRFIGQSPDGALINGTTTVDTRTWRVTLRIDVGVLYSSVPGDRWTFQR